jgi:hypothetical protein|tara:strand:+ start:1902 stop:2174 length:273 start_codon:yes stop_codon:yes gene_type:complete
MRDKIIQAMKDHAIGHIKKHKMNVDIYLDKAVGVGGEAHPDVLETIEKELNIVAMYDDQLEMLNKYFKDEEAKTLNEVVQDKIKNDDGGW